MIENNKSELEIANDYNDYFTRIIKLSKVKRVGYVLSIITHYIFVFLFIFMVVFLFNIIFNIDSKTVSEMIATLPIINKAADSETWIIATVWGVLTLIVFIMPFILLLIYLLIVNICVPKRKTNSLTGDVLSVISASAKKGKQALSVCRHCSYGWEFQIVSGIIFTAIWIIFCVFGWIYSWHDSNTSEIIAILFGCVFCGFIVYLVGYIISLPYVHGFDVIIDSYDTEKTIEKKTEHLDSLWNSINDDREQKKKAAEEERLRKIAEQAEQEWQTLENPESNEALVKELAKDGSPSACEYLGKKLTEKYASDLYTKSEKENIYSQAIKYLKVSAAAGNINSRFLYLALSVQKESYSLDEWKSILTELRSIQKSDKFSHNHIYSCKTAIEYVVRETNRAEADEIRKNQPIYIPSYPKAGNNTDNEDDLNRIHDDLDAIQDVLGDNFSDGM